MDFPSAIRPLLFFMVAWVLVFPASYRYGWWKAHDTLLFNVNGWSFVPTPLDVISKYGGHPLVKLTHILPSGIWSLCGAMQLNPSLRVSKPRLHRLTGRVMLFSSILVAIGYVLLEARGLSASAPPFTDFYGFQMLMVWFVYTAARAGWAARSRRYGQHARWAVRHIASGAWVIVQRVILGTMTVVAGWAGVMWSPEGRHRGFGAAAAMAVVVTLLAAEAFVRGSGMGGWARLGAKGSGADVVAASGRQEAAVADGAHASGVKKSQ